MSLFSLLHVYNDSIVIAGMMHGDQIMEGHDTSETAYLHSSLMLQQRFQMPRHLLHVDPASSTPAYSDYLHCPAIIQPGLDQQRAMSLRYAVRST
jgi:hypothetical protein